MSSRENRVQTVIECIAITCIKDTVPVKRVVRHLNVTAVPLKGFLRMDAANWTHAILIRVIITWLKSGLTWWYSLCLGANIVAFNQ